MAKASDATDSARIGWAFLSQVGLDPLYNVYSSSSDSLVVSSTILTSTKIRLVYTVSTPNARLSFTLPKARRLLHAMDNK